MSAKLEINSPEFEIANAGFSNGISTQLKTVLDRGEMRSLNEDEKWKIIDEAAIHYGNFLTALGCNWKEDPNSADTPRRVAKAYVQDLWKGRYEIISGITRFPSDGYTGIVLEQDIPLTSQCSHHAQNILGKVHIGYIPGEESLVVGLSKLNRIVELFGRRGAIQEQLTKAIHNAIDSIIPGNLGVIVIIQATHACVSCRGIKHQGASMSTSVVSGVFADPNNTAKAEVFDLIKNKI